MGVGIVSSVEFLVLSIALGMDLFSVTIPIGMKPMNLLVIFRAALTFAVFHIVLILTGYHMGHSLGAIIENLGADQIRYPMIVMQNWASILGALVLVGLGVHMIRENFHNEVEETGKSHPLQGFSLLLLAVSVSLDALAAGFSMGMMDVDLLLLSCILGAIIFSIAIAGLTLGRQVGQYIGKRAELMGGIVLIFLGLHILWQILI